MNGKKAKALRRKAYNLVIQYMKDLVLPEGEYTEEQILRSIPYVLYRNHLRTRSHGILTGKWFIKQVKKNPEVTYEQAITRAGLKTAA